MLEQVRRFLTPIIQIEIKHNTIIIEPGLALGGEKSSSELGSC